MMTPHQILHPQPTRQNIIVNIWPIPMNKLMQKAPSLAIAVSFTENLGFPKHKHNIPLVMVPKMLENKLLT